VSFPARQPVKSLLAIRVLRNGCHRKQHGRHERARSWSSFRNTFRSGDGYDGDESVERDCECELKGVVQEAYEDAVLGVGEVLSGEY
jgi:hypothetical protein